MAFILISVSGCSRQPSSKEKNEAAYLKHIQQGQEKENAGQDAEALTLYLKAKAVLPEEPGVYYRLARVSSKLRRADIGMTPSSPVTVR